MSSCSIMGMVFVTLMVFAIAEVGADHVHTHDDNYTSPSLSPYNDTICEEVDCGKGKCIVDTGYPFNFKCECEAGWKRTRHFDEDDFHFLPCTIPNCSLDYSCMPAAAPTPAVQYNVSVYDPCYWIYCGEGTCNRNKTYRHTCECRPGYHNALNISFYPCYSDCALGSDCEKLGVVRSSNSTASTPANGGTRGTPYLAGKFLLMSFLALSIMVVFWK